MDAPTAGDTSGVLLAVLGALGTIATAAVTYLLGRRTSSGTVQTTEAKDLWAQTWAFVAVQTDKIANLTLANEKKDELIDRLRKELADCRNDRVQSVARQGGTTS